MVVKPQHIYGSYIFKVNQGHAHHKLQIKQKLK